MDSEKKNEKESKYVFIYLLSFFFIGLFNNLGYVLVWVSSSDLSKALNKPDLVTVYLIVLQLVNLITRIVHMNFCITVTYKFKVYLYCLLNFVGYISFYLILIHINYKDPHNVTLSFFLSMLPTIFLGISCTVGEVAMVGYLKKFPSTWISGFSGGTGMAGVSGALIKIIFVLTGTKSDLIWLIMSSSSFIYFGAYIITEKLYYIDSISDKKDDINDELIDRKSENGNNDLENDENILEGRNNRALTNKSRKSLYSNKSFTEVVMDNDLAKEVEETEILEVKKNKTFSWENMKEALRMAGYYIYNIGISYFVSYNIVHFAERYEAFKYIDEKNVSFLLKSNICGCHYHIKLVF